MNIKIVIVALIASGSLYADEVSRLRKHIRDNEQKIANLEQENDRLQIKLDRLLRAQRPVYYTRGSRGSVVGSGVRDVGYGVGEVAHGVGEGVADVAEGVGEGIGSIFGR